MGAVRDWLTSTSVPRWQIAAAFLLATGLTSFTTIKVQNAIIEKQDEIAKRNAFRESASQLDVAARDLVYGIYDEKKYKAERKAFDHALLVHVKDAGSLRAFESKPGLVDHYVSDARYVAVLAGKLPDVESGRRFLVGMGELQRRQIILMDHL